MLTESRQKKPLSSFVFFVILSFFFIENIFAHEEEDAATLPTVGNFALPASQQPSPLISFGQNIFDQGILQLYAMPDTFQGPNDYTTELIPYAIYTFTDNFSGYLSVPVALADKDGDVYASGLEDVLLQLEYAIYAGQTSTYADQMTIVVNGTIPTGSDVDRRLPTNFTTASFFVGSTFSRTYVDWYLFTSEGAVLTRYDDGEKIGNSGLYQFGIGRHISSAPSEYIFAALLEATGAYTGKTNKNNALDPNSGGNVVYLTPSLFFSTPKIIAQLGVGFPVIQNLFGDQNKIDYLVTANFGWTF